MKIATSRTNGWLAAIAMLLIASSVSGCAMSEKVDIRRFVTSGRDGWQQPEKVLAALDLAPGARVAEIGAGDGYWIGWLSDAVGPDGRVYAVEVDADKVETLSKLVADEGYANVDVIFGEYGDPLLPDGAVDVVITSLTYHHIEDRVVYFEKLKTDLSAQGRIVHLDNRSGLPFPISLKTSGHTSEVEQIDDEMTRAGYTRVALHDFLYTQIFVAYLPDDR